MKIRFRDIVFIGVGLVPFLLGFLGRFHFLPDLLSHFRVHYLGYFLILFFYAFFTKNRFLKIGSGVISLFIISSLSMLYIPNFSKTKNIETKEEQRKISLCATNLFSGNRDHKRVLNYLEKKDFDILIFQELTPTWEQKLRVLNEKYPFGESRQLNSNFGIGIKSKLPIEDLKFHKFSRYNVPTIEAIFKVGGKKLTIIGTHPVPPTNAIAFEDRNTQFKKINELIQKTEGEIIVAGDMNCTSWSPNFSLLSEGTSLRDSRHGFGIQPTWWAGIPVVSIPIDHILVSKGISVLKSKTGKNIGSDHLPKELFFTFD